MPDLLAQAPCPLSTQSQPPCHDSAPLRNHSPMTAKSVASDPVSKAAAGLKPFTDVGVVGRVPAVYLKLAFWPFVSFLSFCRINKLRIINERAEFDPPPLPILSVTRSESGVQGLTLVAPGLRIVADLFWHLTNESREKRVG